MKNNKYYNTLIQKIKAFRKRKKVFAVLDGVFNFTIFAVPVWLGIMLLSMLLRNYRPHLLAVFFLFAFAIAALYVIIPLLKIILNPEKPSINQTAKEIGTFYENVNDRLVNALQLVQNTDRDRNRVSIDLVNAALQNMSLHFENFDFRENLDTAFIPKKLKKLALIFSIFALFVFLLPAGKQSFLRLLHPFIDYSGIDKIEFYVDPGNALVLKGEDVPLKVWVSDSSVANLNLKISQNSIIKQVELAKAADDTFRYTFDAVRDSLSFICFAHEQQSNSYSINIVEPPLLKKIQVKIVPPIYSNLAPFLLEENVANIQALKGSQIQLSAFANKPVQDAKFVSEKHGTREIQVESNRLSVQFSIHSDDEYYIDLHDQLGNANPSPIHYSIKILPDQYPYVQIISPGKDIDLPEEMIIPLAVEAEDDYGLSKIEIGSQVILEGMNVDSSGFVFQEIGSYEPNEDFVSVALNWDISNADMYPTDVLAYFVQVFDNDVISGPKVSKSRIYYARFPSLYEMYEEMTLQQDENIEDMEEVLEKSKDLEEKLEQLNRELERDPEMDWQKKQEIQDAVNNQQEIQNQVKDIAQELNEMMESMEENNMLSEETLEKYKELQELFKDIMTPELQEVMEQMNKALENLDEKKLQDALQNFKLNEEEFNKKLERNINLLKKLKAEQKLDQALKMTKELSERQENVSENAKDPNADTERLASEEQHIQKDAESLENLLQELQQDMSELATLPKEPVDQAQQKMQDDQLLQKMQQMADQLNQNQTGAMQQQSQQAQQTLQEMQQSLQQAQQMMNNNNQMQMLQAMRKTGRQLLQLSQQQEQLQKQTSGMNKNDPTLGETAEKQQQLSSALNRVLDELYNEMNQSTGVDSKISEMLGKAAGEMGDATRAMEQRDNNTAAKQQGEAMSSLNNAAKQVQQAMQNMMQQQGGGSGSMSYQQFMQQMQKLANSQQMINEESLQMSMMQGMAQQQMMSRLGQRQGQVRKSMQQLAQEAGDSDELLGSMEKIVEDMEQIEKDFTNNQISRETIQRQNRILSRMLDAQKSIRQREYSRERQAETGQSYTAESPKPLSENPGERENQLKQDLLRAKKEGYSADYLQMIENYFKVLSENEK